ncbi:amidohydrolase [Nitzschia inconspicua]|uniref:Amidohydrolase n=1 Tax=Nitzschia inconspicua TaxID=303405 RepID=A0A9K3PWA9_9STRA|nr:amidohydrolase [Nitzschia inconspicua]
MKKTTATCLSLTSALMSWLPQYSLGQETPSPVAGGDGGGVVELPQVVLEEIARCGSPFDAHLHLEAQWFPPDNAQPLLAEMTASGIDQGILMAIVRLSFFEYNTNWEAVKDDELTRMKTYLEMDGFVAVKLAPPHTRLAMNSTIICDILQEVSQSSKPIVAIHIGTTPFCGPFGDFILGQRGLCTPEFVDPFYLEDYISTYSNVTFVMMHGGQDFDDGTSGDVPFYNGELFDHSLDLMGKYENIVLEISAMLATEAPDDASYRNPLAFENLLKVVEAGMQERTIYGSDANQFPGGIISYLISTVNSLIAAKFSEEERCRILVDFPKEVYNIPEANVSTPSVAPVGTPSSSASTSTTMPSDHGLSTSAPTLHPTLTAGSITALPNPVSVVILALTLALQT